MLCRSCSNIQFQWFEEIPDAATYAQNLANAVFESCNKYVVSSIEQKFYIHQPDFHHLTSSKDEGCYLCAALWYAFKAPSSDPKQGAIDSITAGDCSAPLTTNDRQCSSHETPGFVDRSPVVWRVFASRRPQYASDMWFNVENLLYVFCGNYQRNIYRVETPKGVFARFTERIHELWESKELLQLDDSTQSDTTLELAKLWYSSCISNHPICAERDAQTTTSSILPKRVIDLRSAGSEPVLYEPAEGEGGKYICLSHCWGDTKPLHIVRQDDGSQSTSPRTYSLPPLATWPQTFQDAVDIARKFNIRYLWIDNTSIKQGDKEDWSTESQRMAQYFGNATFTLAATGSTNDDAGLYYPRNPLLTYPLRLLEAADVPPRNDYYVSLMGLNHIDQHEVLDAPLYSRAWVLQEQQLSRRILKFGRRGIYWECLCCSTTAANIMPGEMTPYHHQGFGGGQFLRMQIHATQSNTPANAGRNPYLDLWYATVQEFTSRNMKMKSDALPALSGLAQSYACYMNKDDQYVAGLWQSDLLLGLLWTAEVAGTRRLPIRAGLTNYDSTGFSGPSWSWISHCHRRIRLYFAEKILPGGRCNYLENTSLVGTEVTSVDIEYKPSSAPYGEVEAGRLSIKARLPSVRITTTPFKPNGNRRNMVHDSMAKTTILPLTMDRTAFDEYWLDVVTEGEKGLSLRGECDIDDMDSELWLSRVRDGEFEATFLPLIMYRGDPEGLRTAGLVLLPSENGRDEFVRVGRAQVDLPNRHIFEKSTLPIRQLTIV